MIPICFGTFKIKAWQYLNSIKLQTAGTVFVTIIICLITLECDKKVKKEVALTALCSGLPIGHQLEPGKRKELVKTNDCSAMGYRPIFAISYFFSTRNLAYF